MSAKVTLKLFPAWAADLAGVLVPFSVKGPGGKGEVQMGLENLYTTGGEESSVAYRYPNSLSCVTCSGGGQCGTDKLHCIGNDCEWRKETAPLSQPYDLLDGTSPPPLIRAE